MSEKIELNIGDHIYVDEKEYIIYSFRYIVDTGGRAIEIHAQDPLQAAKIIEDRKKHKETLEQHLRMAQKVEDELSKT